MSSIRPSLLADQRDQEDWRRGLGLALLCVLLSVWFHLAGFIIWQQLDQNAPDSFVFELMPEKPPLELTLVFNEPLEMVSETGAGEGASTEDDPPAAGQAQAASEAGDGAMTAMAADSPVINSEDEPVEDHTPVNPEPPIKVEGAAPENKSYYTAVRMAVNNRWIMPPAAKTQFRPGRLTVDFTILRDGTLSHMIIIGSTGNNILDHAGQEAIRSAAPFPPFPDDLKKFSQLEIRMHFDYKAQYLPRQIKP